ncbi:carbon-nitrogen hydrolase family protein [Phenylobacterium ferrooxidans]|uniref:Carbon-nitrogen hydrolase family protein n=1 Tax=Phenylobacterium ferrooxidans TaxID=2982689 RepID=A0ABW6CQ81_9CAUL
MPRIAAAQTPEFREDVEAALAYALTVIAEATAQGADLLVFPEGYLQGYLTQEAPARRHALNLTGEAFTDILARLPKTGPTLVMGLIEEEGGALHNTAAVTCAGKLLGRYRKTHLLAGEAFFTPGTDGPAFEAGGVRFGINICYDTNFPQAAAKIAEAGATLLVCPANNMMKYATAEHWRDRHNPARAERCRETGLWLISSDVTGQRGDRIAWGPTAVLNPQGEVVAQLPLDQPGLLVFEMP